uniref:Uncharacterized protein n=1 Tax=Oryza rufipogon TaxID=4529 RepID=A0A0E0QWH8_ORYRU
MSCPYPQRHIPPSPPLLAFEASLRSHTDTRQLDRQRGTTAREWLAGDERWRGWLGLRPGKAGVGERHGRWCQRF